MSLATYWTTDPLPALRPLPGLTVSPRVDDAALALLNRLSLQEVRARRAAGHRAYGAYLHGTPVGYGWVATRAAEIGELGLTFSLPAGNRYLWDFATLPAWRGRGLYPRLLQGILQAERHSADRFWILHAPENLPSGAGIGRAGFQPVGELSFDAAGRVTLVPSGDRERAEAGAALFGMPLMQSDLTPCWCCANGDHPCGCTPTDAALAGTCACAVALKSNASHAA